MEYRASAQDLRNLLSVATKLRQLAVGTLQDDDRDLYLMAAAALESRAAKNAASLPGHENDSEETPGLYRHINVMA